MPANASPRLPFLDWLRGLVAVVMLQGHTFHSFTRKDLQESGPFVISQFIGGIAPAVFLFLLGVTYGFRMARSDREGYRPWRKWTEALRRARYLLLLAFAFRLQLWVFAWNQSPWTDLFKVDILNCMALALAVLSVGAVLPGPQRVRFMMGAGCAVAALSPLVSALDANLLPWFLRDYFVPNYNFFGFFPWAAFVAFGIGFGSLLRLIPADQISRTMQWTAFVGVVLLFFGRYAADFPYSIYPKSDFWLDSPNLVWCKLGIIFILLSLAYLWNESSLAARWSWIRQIGTTSLLVYWVHIELVYGRWFGFWKQALTIPQVSLFAAVLILAMLGLSIAKTRWSTRRTAAATRTERVLVAGD